MKRWYCPTCKAVHTARPEGYSPGIQYPHKMQIESIRAKLSGRPFLKNIPRQVQQHWYKNFNLHRMIQGNWEDSIRYMETHSSFGQLWVTKRFIQSDTLPGAVLPYLSLAVTVRRGFFKLE